MNEDNARNRKDNGPQNLPILRHIALNIIRERKIPRLHAPLNSNSAAWNDHFLATLLAQI